MTSEEGAISMTDLAPLSLVAKGKVREIYALDDDRLLFVTTDRISAFDVVLENVCLPHLKEGPLEREGL